MPHPAYRPLTQQNQLGGYVLDPIDFLPSVELNRVTGSGDGSLKETNALVLRAGLVARLARGNDNVPTLWDYQILSLNYRAAGTTAGDDFEQGGELEWEPMRHRRGEYLSINGPYRAFDPEADPQSKLFHYRFTLTGKLEFGESVDQAYGNTFVKLGPKAGLYLQPVALPRFELFGLYSYLWELADDSRDFDNLETGVRYALDPAKQIFVEVKYRGGQVPAKYTDIDLWQAALSVRF